MDSKMIKTESDEEKIGRLVQPEIEIEIPIGNGKRKTVFWKRLGFDGRVYFKSFFLKKLKDLVASGALATEAPFKEELKEIEDGEGKIFSLTHKSLDEGTLKVYKGGTLLKSGLDYTFNPDFGVLFLTNPTKDRISASYEYYNDKIYQDIFQDSFVVVLIFLCAMDIADHSKRIFDKIYSVGELTSQEVNEITQIYTSGKFDLKELKN